MNYSPRKFAHEFVAIALPTAPLHPSGGGALEAHFTLPEKTAAPVNALTAWVYSAKNPAPIQAVGGPIP